MISVKTHGFAKKLGALVMAMAMTCSLAISASALDANTKYTPNLSGLPATHQGKVLDYAETEADGTLYVYFQESITISGKTGSITDVTLGSGAATGYAVEGYEDAVLTISYPAGTDVEDFSIPLVLKISVDGDEDGHEGGMEMNSTLTLS